VSKAGHCLNDLLYRRAGRSLRIDVPLVLAIISNLATLFGGGARRAFSSTCPRS